MRLTAPVLEATTAPAAFLVDEGFGTAAHSRADSVRCGPAAFTSGGITGGRVPFGYP